MNQETNTVPPLDELLRQSLPDIKERLKKEISDKLIRQTQYELNDLCSATVKDWFKEELANAIKGELESQRPIVLAAVKTFSVQAADSIGAALALSLNEKLKNSWDRKKLAEVLFG